LLEHSRGENVITSTLELILIMTVREGAAQEKAQLISRIVSSVVVQRDGLPVPISKVPSAPSFWAPEGR
jgi:hypothetical protein